MRVAVIVVLASVLSTPSEASKSCMTKTEARQHFASVHIYWHGAGHCWDATPTRRHHRISGVMHRHHPAHQADRKVRSAHNKAHEGNESIRHPKWYESMSEMLPDEEPAQTAWTDRWVHIEPPQIPIVARWVEIAQVTPAAVIESNVEPTITLRAVMMVIVTVAGILLIVGILFGSASWGYIVRWR